MKFGILTYHAPCNFGANLQAFCSANFFASRGYEVKVINYIRPGDKSADYCVRAQFYGHWNFSQNTLPVTKPVDSEGIVAVIKEEKIDVLVLGADAIWNKNNLDVFDVDWLWNSEIANLVKVVCLSPAFMGQSYMDLSDDRRERFKQSLLRFSYLNTRDEWTRKRVNKDIVGFELIKKTNPDPVFLLNDFCNVEWKNDNSSIIPKKYYVVSFPKNFIKQKGVLKRLWMKIFKAIVHRHGYKLVELPIPEGVSGLKFDYTVPYPIDPLQWYLWLKNAKGFIGLRFHAVLSCLSAGTPFFSLDVYGRRPRIVNYLNAFGIHCLDRRTNVASKIRNLLEGSGLEKYRINGSKIHMVSPFKIFKLLEKTDVGILQKFKEKNILEFYENMNEMFSILEKKDE